MNYNQVKNIKLLNLAMKSNDDKKDSMHMHSFVQMSTMKKLINRISLKSKQSIATNILKLTIYKNTSFSLFLLLIN